MCLNVRQERLFRPPDKQSMFEWAAIGYWMDMRRPVHIRWDGSDARRESGVRWSEAGWAW